MYCCLTCKTETHSSNFTEVHEIKILNISKYKWKQKPLSELLKIFKLFISLSQYAHNDLL